MECVPDLAFLQMAAASNSDMFNKMLWHPSPAAAAAAAATTSPNSTANSGTMKQRKTNFTSREVEALLNAVADRKDTVLFGVAGGIGWARAWHEVAQQVSAVEGIHRSESDVRKKWTYLKWEAKNTSKPGRDPTSRAVLDILTSQNPGSQPSNSLLEQLLVPGSPSSPNQSRSTVSPVPIAPKKHTAPSQSQQSVSSTNSTQERQSAQSQQTSQLPQPPEVCLKWNSYHSNMRATFPSLLNNEQFVDVTLACEGRSIKCHKVMLSACSSYFEELLSQNPCQHPIVFMRDLKFWEVQALVEFMYSGEVNVTQDRLPSLLAAADALQIKGLAGPSTGSNSAEDTEDDLIHHVQQQQKRVRKRKSTNPTAYPVRSQCLAQNSTKQNVEKTQQTLQHQLKKVQAAPKSSHGVLSSSGYSPPSKTRRDEDHPNSPLALIKDEPLDLGIDSKNQTNRHKNTEPPQIKNEKDENGLSEDETDSRPDDYAYDDDEKRYDNGNDDEPRSSRESTPKNDK